MLEPPTPAGEPFAAQEVDENNNGKTSADFESVCISLVERGWKIMPKKGTYPINKKGPRYINLVDPRGNRKSVRVIDENLWEKLRAAEARRTGKNVEEIESPKTSEFDSSENVVQSSTAETSGQPMVESTPMSSFESVNNCTSTPESQSMTETIPVITTDSSQVPTEPAVLADVSPVEMAVVHGTEIEPHPVEEPAQKAEIVQNPPREIQNFALSSPGLQKSIFDLGFETLLNTLQSETLSPGEIISKIQEWSLESKNLLEFVHKSQEKTARPQTALPDTSEKDQLIAELQSTLKEVEDKLAETIKSLNEM